MQAQKSADLKVVFIKASVYVNAVHSWLGYNVFVANTIELS